MLRRNGLKKCVLSVMVILVLGLGCPTSADPPAPKTGDLTLTFNERSPHSDLKTMFKRMGWTYNDTRADYDLSKFNYTAYVPQAYSGSEAYGLLVYISPSPQVFDQRQYKSIYDKQKLIFIGANGAGNQQTVWFRLGLALDAVHNMKKQYNIDPRRIYVTGVSGGGRCASQLGICYADVFEGALPIVGCDYHRRIKSIAQPDKGWNARYKRPDLLIYNKARRFCRYVLMTGENDYNRDQTLAIYKQGYSQERFAYATYMEVPGMGHTAPPAQWLEKALAKLDEPLAELEKKGYKPGPLKVGR